MARRFNRRLIKIHHSYTIDEAARALGAHKNTVRTWVRRKKVALVCDRRPHLIQGRALREFLATEQAKTRTGADLLPQLPLPQEPRRRDG